MTIDAEGRLVKVTQADVRNNVLLLPPEIKIIGSRAFAGVFIAKLIWNCNVQKIESYGFSAASFEELKIPKSVETIQDNAFSENGMLQKIEIMNPDCGFSREAFAYCSFLKSIKWHEETYVVRCFNDGAVWQIFSKIGHDVVNSYRGKLLFSDEPLKYASKRINIIGYGDTLKEAIAHVVKDYYAQSELREKWKGITLDTPITTDDFRELTGICMEGTYRWVKEQWGITDVKKTTKTIREVLNDPKFQNGVSPNIYQPLIQFIAEMYEERTNDTNK